MSSAQIAADRESPGGINRLSFEVRRRATATGLIGPDEPAGGDLASIRRLADRVEKAGLATSATTALRNVEAPTPEEVESLLRMIVVALEASPAPKFEWRSPLVRIFEPDHLAPLLNISSSSVKRYQSGERTTPDAVAARLHFLALVTGDLAGSYNDIGIRRWFQRKRTILNGRSPAQLLAGDWDPDDEGPQRVRQAARELVALSAT